MRDRVSSSARRLFECFIFETLSSIFPSFEGHATCRFNLENISCLHWMFGEGPGPKMGSWRFVGFYSCIGEVVESYETHSFSLSLGALLRKIIFTGLLEPCMGGSGFQHRLHSPSTYWLKFFTLSLLTTDFLLENFQLLTTNFSASHLPLPTSNFFPIPGFHLGHL